MNKRVAGLALLPFLAVLSIAACSSGPGQITVKGKVEVDYTVSGASDPYSDGTQVVVYNSDHDVIGTGTLSASTGTTAPFGGYADNYTFTVTLPAGLPRYGFEVGGQHGMVWESAKQLTAGPSLDLDLTSNPLSGF